jgi:hypothetical protein
MSLERLEITCVRGEVTIHSRKYPMYSGFMTPNQLIKFADVPSFPEDSTHTKLSINLTKDPVTDWQRPVDRNRLTRIRKNVDAAKPNTSEFDTLMANPVLIGRSDKIKPNPIVNQDCSISINPMRIPLPNGSNVAVPDVSVVQIDGDSSKKPLWILDGQHRIHGLGQSPFPVDDKGKKISENASILADEVIPVVFVIDEDYNPEFLAKIFTEVTTESEKMSPIHEDWMQYAFHMKPYDRENTRSAMEVVIELTNRQKIDSIKNNFYNKIQFNPKEMNFGEGVFKYTSVEFRRIIEMNYFENIPIGKSPKSSEDITQCIVRFYRACCKLDDAQTLGNSKLLSPSLKGGKGGSKFLATIFLSAFLDYIAMNEDTISKTQDQWEYFLQDPARNFQDCDWTLDAISPGSMETNAARKASKKSAELSFQRFFNNPDIMDGIHVTDYMMGPDVFEYRTAKMSKAFPNSETKYLPGELVGNQGVNTLNIRKHDHSQIRFLSKINSRTTITALKVIRYDGTTEKIPAGNVKTAIKFEKGPTNRTATIHVKTLCLGELSEKVMELKIVY